MATDWKEGAALFSPVWLMDEDGRMIGYKDFNGRYYRIPQFQDGTAKPTDVDPPLPGVTPGTGNVWGQITGTLSNQADVYNAIQGKADVSYVDAQLSSRPLTTTVNAQLALKADVDSPAFTGNPTAPTEAPGQSDSSIATCAWVQGEIGIKANLNSPTFTGTPSAPTATAGDSSTRLATTAFVANATAGLAPLASPGFTGVPQAPTAVPGTNTTQLATTAFVQNAIAGFAPSANPTFTGTPTAPTAAPGTNTQQIATTAFVTTAVAAVPGATWGSVAGTLANQTDLNNALNAKADASATSTALAAKAPLASPAFTGVPTAPTAANGTNTAQIATTAFVQASLSGVSPVWGNVTGTLSNQSDLNTALNGKVPTTRTINGYDLSANRTLTKSDIGLSNVDNTADSAKPVSTAQQTEIDKKGNVTLLTSAEIAAPTVGQLADRRAIYVASDDGGYYRRYRSNGVQLVEIIDSIDNTSAFNRQTGRLEVSRARSAYKYTSQASGSLIVGSKEFVGFFIESQSAADDITFYDNASAASGTILLKVPSPAVNTWYELPAPVVAINGIYVSIANAGNKTFSIKRSE